MFKENAKNSISAVKKHPGRAAARLVLFSAFCAFIAACYLYWSTESAHSSHQYSYYGEKRAVSQAAQAEGMRMSAEVMAAVLSKEAKLLYTGMQAEDDAAVAGTLTRVYPELAESGYFMLWRGTVSVCSPMNKDAWGMDFDQQRDAQGVHFVRELAKLADEGGGFYTFVLPYEASGSPGAVSRDFSSQFVAYVTPVAGTDLYLTLWRPVDPAAFSLQAELIENGGVWSLVGLCMSGLSFLGVSVLLRGLRES